jgi:hypothetical protein
MKRNLLPTAVRALLAVALAGTLAACGGGAGDAAGSGPTTSAAESFTNRVAAWPASDSDQPFATDGTDEVATETEEPVPLGT